MLGLPRWLSGKEFTCQYWRCGFNPWVRKIPRRRKWRPAPVFLPGKSHGQRNLVGYSLWGSQRVRHNLATEHTRMCECYLKTPLYWLVWWPSHALNQFTLSEEERRENGYWVGNSLFVTHLPLDIEVVCHSLLQGTTFCQNPPP